MTARGPPPSLSIPPSYPQGGGAGQSSDSLRSRGRNRSAGSSGPSSREHSVEGRDNRRGLELRGGGDFRASYHNQYKGPGRREAEKVGRVQQQELQRPQFAIEARKEFTHELILGEHSFGSGRDGGLSSEKDKFWTNQSNRSRPQGRGQQGEENAPLGIGGPSSTTRGYSLTIRGDSRQGRGQGHEADNQGSRRSSRQENGYGGFQRQSGSQRLSTTSNRWQEDVYGGGYESRGGGQGRMATATGGGGSSSSRGRHYGAEERGGGAGAGALWTLTGRDTGDSKEGVFGDGRELHTFGSPTSLSRPVKDSGSFLPSREENSSRWGSSSAKYAHEGDSRRSFANESVSRGDGWSGGRGGSGRSSVKGGHLYSNNNAGPAQRTNVDVIHGNNTAGERQRSVDHRGAQRQTSRDQPQVFRGGDQAQVVSKRDPDVIGNLSRRTSSSRSSSNSYVRQHNNVDGWNDSREGVSQSCSPSVSSSTKGSFSSKNSLERRHRSEEESPVFTPSSFSRNNSLEKRHGRDEFAELSTVSPRSDISEAAIGKRLSRESSVSESSRQDLDGWSAAAQLTSGSSRGWGAASLGSQSTRTTDWYEICLQEEEEEAFQALARKSEVKIAVREPNPSDVRSFSRTGSWDKKDPAFNPQSSAVREIKRDHLDTASLQERLGNWGDAVDVPQVKIPSSSEGKTTSESAETQMLFTPWNVHLQYSPNIKSGLQMNKRTKPFRQFEKSPTGEWRDGGVIANERFSLAGGRQAVGRGTRRASNSGPAADSENWRTGSRVQSRDSRNRSKDGPKPDLSQDFTEVASNRSSAGTAEAADTSQERSEIERHFASAIVASQTITPPASTGIRSSAFYRAFNSTDSIADEDPLPHIIGTCPDMCPAKERLQRERLRDLAVFERVSGDTRTTSKDLAVKKFCRTVVASELEQSDVRPLPVLWRTQQYLMGLLDDPQFAFDIVHNFLFDRTRAIRQELGMQRIDDHQSITLHEEMVRFHILSQHELRNLNRKRSKQVDTHLNLQQLSKSLHSLLNLYMRLGAGSEDVFENEAEFYAYYVLLNLGNHGQFQAEPLSIWFPNVPSRVGSSAPMRFARKALRLYRSNNYVGYFRLVMEATYLQSCLLELSFDSLRATALAAINASAYKMHPFPLSDLARLLIVTEEEVGELCRHYGLVTGKDNTSQRLCLLPKQAQFAVPEREERPLLSCLIIDKKRASTFFLEVKGAATRSDGTPGS